MINLRVMSAVAALALVLPMATPVESHAAGRGFVGGGGGARSFSGGGGGGMHFGGGGFRAGAIGGGARFAASPGFVRPSVAAAPVARFGGGAAGPRYAGNWNGGWHGGYRRHGGFWPGLAAGALVGGALAANAYYDPYYYGGGYGYYDNSYYDGGYYDNGYDDGTVAVVPGGGDSTYCAQRYRSYDPASGTYLGYDGQRHPCP